MRKESGLAVSDRIVLTVGGGPDVRAVVESFGGWIASEVLAAELVVAGEPVPGEHDMHTVDLDGLTARVGLTRIQ